MLREFREEDAKSIIELSNKLSRFNYLKNKENRLLETKIDERLQEREKLVKKRIRESIEDNDKRYYVKEFQNEIIGYIYTYQYDKSIHLEEMYVNEKFRGKGIARKMLDQLEDLAKQKEIKRITLNVYLWNEAAINLYNKQEYSKHYMNMYKNI